MKIAVAQVDAARGRRREKYRGIIFAAIKERCKKADVIVFPELSLTGYSVRDLNWDVAINLTDPSVLKELLKLSKSITIIAGGVEERKNFGLYNSAFVLEDGKVHSGHRKIYPPTYGMFEEMRYFSQGSDVRNFNSKHGKLGILISRRPVASFASIHSGERRSGCHYCHRRQSYEDIRLGGKPSVGNDQQRIIKRTRACSVHIRLLQQSRDRRRRKFLGRF